MKFSEVLELHRTVTAFHDSHCQESPSLGIFDAIDQNGGYVLCIRTSSASRDYLSFLRSLAEARKLGIRHFRGCLMIYST